MVLRTTFLLLALLVGIACSSPRFHRNETELADFFNAGPVTPEFDLAALYANLDDSVEILIGPGDLLQIEMPAIAASETFSSSVEPNERVVVRRRVSRAGAIALAHLGEVRVEGLSLLDIERVVAAGLHPKYLSSPARVVVSIEELATLPVTVVGTVQRPGRYRLKRHELSLTDALSAAGGISSGDGEFAIGARGVVIYRPGETQGEELMLPVRHLNVPTHEVRLRGGERIEVVRYEPRLFAVLGLVNRAGTFQFPVESKVGLLDAIARAGGVDPAAAPPYATIFRQSRSTGEVIAATFDLRDPIAAAKVEIQAGDIVHVDHTVGTWTRSFLSNAIQLRVGGSADLFQ